MKRIDFSKLRESDIPLTTGVENNSGVMHVTRRDVCQAMLYVANGSVVDSTGDAVHARTRCRRLE
ncbi:MULTISPECIES: hypothetical protein [Achromobacter]|uniref:Uncharacterized protein n=1 Tax=Achromobacter spanius TaxID=217203 RepID=A0AA42LUM4_9BURK|nr:hypothetical protein [Achromobacter spanius]MDH0739910.1 hypothetical protein [Achromobacter spanius]